MGSSWESSTNPSSSLGLGRLGPAFSIVAAAFSFGPSLLILLPESHAQACDTGWEPPRSWWGPGNPRLLPSRLSRGTHWEFVLPGPSRNVAPFTQPLNNSYAIPRTLRFWLFSTEQEKGDPELSYPGRGRMSSVSLKAGLFPCSLGAGCISCILSCCTHAPPLSRLLGVLSSLCLTSLSAPDKLYSFLKILLKPPSPKPSLNLPHPCPGLGALPLHSPPSLPVLCH